MSGKIAVVGGGAWGTALAVHLARRPDREVVLWARSADDVATMRHTGFNRHYLPEVPLPLELGGTEELGAAVDGADPVLVVVPSGAMTEIARALRPYLEGSGATVVSATKGIEPGSLARMTEVLAREIPGITTVALSGPTFALELAARHPTVAVAASNDAAAAARVQAELSDEAFRVYASDDPVGVEIAGALKNVMAIAAGIVSGMGFGSNTLAAIVTRGLAELARLGCSMGGRSETFAGIAGMGDLVLTSTGQLSRNRKVGERLGQGVALEEILRDLGHVAEGVRTTETALEFAHRQGVELPMAEQVGRILRREATPGAAVRELMTRELKREHE